MKFLVMAALLLIGLISYFALRDDGIKPLGDEELKQVLSSQGGDSEKLKKSFDRILTKVEMKNRQSSDLEPPPMVADMERLSSDEIYNEFSSKWQFNQQTGMTYIRSAFFNKDVFPEVKGELLDKLHTGPMPKDDFKYFTREVLGRPADLDVFRKALYLHAENLTSEQKSVLAREILERSEDPAIRQLVQEFSEDGSSGD